MSSGQRAITFSSGKILLLSPVPITRQTSTENKRQQTEGDKFTKKAKTQLVFNAKLHRTGNKRPSESQKETLLTYVKVSGALSECLNSFGNEYHSLQKKKALSNDKISLSHQITHQVLKHSLVQLSVLQ